MSNKQIKYWFNLKCTINNLNFTIYEEIKHTQYLIEGVNHDFGVGDTLKVEETELRIVRIKMFLDFSKRLYVLKK